MRPILRFSSAAFFCAAVSLLQAESANPAVRAWRVNPQINLSPGAALRAVLTDVHAVTTDQRFVYVESAGLALQSMGALEAAPDLAAPGPRHFAFRFPLQPKPANAASTATPLTIVGAFLNGVPIANAVSAVSYNDANLWHRDPMFTAPQTPLQAALLQNNGKHSPLIGFAFDGYPIYGPWGWDGQNTLRRFQSSYQLRHIARRDTLLPHTVLTVGQYGPPVDAEFPLGTFAEDYEYIPGSGDLDEHNGRLARTPEYPDGTYAYFLSTYPYLIGPAYAGKVHVKTLRNTAHTSYAALDPEQRPVINLVTPEHLKTGLPQTLSLRFRDDQGRPVRYLETVHERPIHMVVVSSDLKEFAHIHPAWQADDSFEVVHTFPAPGEYWLFADYTRPGSTATVSRFRILVEGTSKSAEPTHPQEVSVTLSPPTQIETGRDLAFRFDITDRKTGQPITDLQPYLGAWAHVMIVPENKRTLIHAHPVTDGPGPHTHAAPGPSPSSITIVTGFRTPGTYRMWAQFQRDGKVTTAPFTIAVGAGAARRLREPAVSNAVRIQVTRAGFLPSHVAVPANTPLRLAFERNDAENCANAVVFPELGIRKNLLAGRTTIVELPPSPPRELSFSCGMGMYKGALVVQ